MGVIYYRHYTEIIKDLCTVISEIEDVHLFAGMSAELWRSLDDKKRRDYLMTFSDDIIYGLGGGCSLAVGRGTARYDEKRSIIKVFDGHNKVSIILLR